MWEQCERRSRRHGKWLIDKHLHRSDWNQTSSNGNNFILSFDNCQWIKKANMRRNSAGNAKKIKFSRRSIRCSYMLGASAIQQIDKHNSGFGVCSHELVILYELNVFYMFENMYLVRYIYLPFTLQYISQKYRFLILQ